MYLLYNVLLFSYFLAVFPLLCYRTWRYGKPLTGVRQRFGRLPVAINPRRTASIWIHAVSVGEVLASRPLIRALRTAYPGHRLLMSTTTTTGQGVAQQFGDELEREPQRIREFYEVRARRIEPVGLVYLWPDTN